MPHSNVVVLCTIVNVADDAQPLEVTEDAVDNAAVQKILDGGKAFRNLQDGIFLLTTYQTNIESQIGLNWSQVLNVDLELHFYPSDVRYDAQFSSSLGIIKPLLTRSDNSIFVRLAMFRNQNPACCRAIIQLVSNSRLILR